MKKILAAIACIAAVAACSTAAFAAGVGDSENVGEGAGNNQATVGDSSNPGTGVVLTVVPTALAAGALTISGIVLKKKNK